MAKIRQSPDKDNRLESKQKFRKKTKIINTLRYLELILIIAIAVKVYLP